MNTRISGNVVSGFGKGTLFTGLDWARQQFVEKLGIDPYPGTLNLELSDTPDMENWQSIQGTTPYRIEAPGAGNCDAICYPVFINHRFSGAAVRPLIDDYPANQIEIVSSICLRQKLGLQDGDKLELEFLHPLTASTVIFDLDGTLLDTIEAFYVLALRTGDEFGITMDRSNVYELLNYGKSYWDAAVPHSTPDRQSVMERMNERALELWPEIMESHAGLFPGIYNTLQILQDRGTRIGIVTGSGKSSIELLYSAGVEDLIDAVITGEDVSRRKPHPEGLHLCMDSLGINADEAVYVGDTSIDMQAGRAAGMKTVAVLSGAGGPAVLCEAGAHRVIQDHSALIEIFNNGRPI